MEPAVLFGSLPLLASAFGFSRVDAKLDDDGFFVGFPSYWNIVVAYLYLLGWPPWLNTLIIAALTVMVFIPTRYIYITRFRHQQLINYGGSLICGVALLAALFVDESLRRPLVYFSLLYPIYYLIRSFVIDRNLRKAAG